MKIESLFFACKECCFPFLFKCEWLEPTKTNCLVNRLGSKQIDPDSGLIYFKYDFGYEFGIIFPGEGRKFVAGGNRISNNSETGASRASNRFLHNSAGVIDIPVQHERSMKPLHFANERNSIDFLQLRRKPDCPATAGRHTVPAIAINVDEFHTNQNKPNSRPASVVYQGTNGDETDSMSWICGDEKLHFAQFECRDFRCFNFYFHFLVLKEANKSQNLRINS